MKAQTKYLKSPPEWQITDAYDSHRPLLWTILENNKHGHPVAEFGSGMGSTKLMREYCEANDIMFFSWDTDEDWCELTGAIKTVSYKNIALPMGYIVFIDGKPGEERKDLIAMHKDKHIVIVHDTEVGAQGIYGTTSILNSFKYRLDFYPPMLPGTTALSNYVNLATYLIL